MGGTNGTAIVTTAMQQLPRRMPKVCISTVAQHKNWQYTGEANITLLDSFVDVSGLNQISMEIFNNCAIIVANLARAYINITSFLDLNSKRSVVGISMLGNTTACVEKCKKALTSHGYETLIFHAIGSGGRKLEGLLKEGIINTAVLDITTHEIAAEILKTEYSAGPNRLYALTENKVPRLIVPGGLDMNILGNLTEAQKQFPDRDLYPCNPEITVMRTTIQESIKIGEVIANKANLAILNGSLVAILIPTESLSMFGEKLSFWHDPYSLKALIGSIIKHAHPNVPIKLCNANINDYEFSDEAIKAILMLIRHEELCWERPS